MRVLVSLVFSLTVGAAFVGGASAAGTSAPITDQIFVETAGHGGAAEIAAGKLALTKTSNRQTLAFANQMIRQHTALAAKLKAAAKSTGLTPPSTPDPAQNAELQALGKLSGAPFDTAYRKQQIAAHIATIALFVTESKSGQSAVLRQAAAAALPLLRMHLKMAEAMPA